MRALSLLPCLLWLTVAAAEPPVDMSGEWVLKDASATDSTSKPGGNSGQGSGHQGGMGGHGGHGRGMGGGGHHGNRQDGSGTADGAAPANAPLDPRLHAHALIIRQSDVVFDIDADGRRMAYRFDNRNNYGATHGGTVTLTWSAPEMVIETHPDDGGCIEEHYTLSPDGQQLALRIVVQRAGEDTPHEIRRTYVRNDNDPQRASTLP